MLAVLFGVIAEYDGDVRWKEDATGAPRTGLARAGETNCQYGDRSDVQPRRRRAKADLEDLVRGERARRGRESQQSWRRESTC